MFKHYQAVIGNLLDTLIGSSWVIAGGYPRDLYLNSIRPDGAAEIIPKDIDFHIYNQHDDSNINRVKAALSRLGLEIDSFGVGASEGCEVSYVIKLKEHPVDIIFYRPEIYKTEHVLETFDWNINQFWLFNKLAVMPKLDTLEQVHPHTNAERMTKAKVNFALYKEWSS